jgi:glycosyltransferase involved in cell wall biosynthesis
VRLFLAVSEYVRQKHIDGGMATERITVKPNFTWAAPRRQGPGEYFIYIGRLSPEKGLPHLLSAWRTIPARLVVVGSGPQESELRSMAPPRVEFRGLVAPADVPALLAGARGMVLPSVCYEAQPRSILEAYAAGVPVVTNRIGGMAEAVVDGETGLLVAPGDFRQWGEAVQRLLDDREADRLGELAYRRWMDRFSPERGLELLEAAYRRALADPSPSSCRSDD